MVQDGIKLRPETRQVLSEALFARQRTIFSHFTSLHSCPRRWRSLIKEYDVSDGFLR